MLIARLKRSENGIRYLSVGEKSDYAESKFGVRYNSVVLHRSVVFE